MENALLFAILGFLFGKINVEISKKSRGIESISVWSGFATCQLSVK
jgi:hypothetical protein